MSGGAIGRGDWVECVDASPGRTNGRLLIQGAVYRVEQIFPELCGELGVTVGLGEKWSWRMSRFRPIYRPKAELLESLLRTTQTPVREDA